MSAAALAVVPPPPNVAERMMLLFAGHRSAHGTHGEPRQASNGSAKLEIKSSARTLRESVTIALWEAHLKGERPLGCIPIDEDNQCRWGCVDVDEYKTNVLGYIQAAESAKLPLVPCRSKSSGLHLFLFLKEPQPAAVVQAVLRNMAERLGLAGSEIFPKQTTVDTERGDVGNWLCVPYFGGTFGGRMREQVGVRKTGAELTIAQFLDAAEKSRVTPAEFERLVERPKTTRASVATVTKLPDDGVADGPPCVGAMLSDGVPEHAGRNKALFHYAVFARKKWPDAWERKLDEFNHAAMRPPLPPEEITGVIKSLRKKDYGFLCSDTPMCELCDRATCLTRPYGIGKQNYPVIVQWEKLNLEEPIWYVTIADSNRVLKIDDIRDLTNYKKFADQCARQLNRFLPPMKQENWTAVLQEKQGELVEIEPPEEITVEGRFRELLDEFLVNRWRGESWDDLLSSKPWHNEDEGRHYFRIRDLHDFLLREKMKWTRNDVKGWIKNVGGGPLGPMTIRGRSVRVWFVPSSAIQPPPEPAKPPPFKKLPI
jgi:hypothetical protein